jgi:hypothetical protein
MVLALSLMPALASAWVLDHEENGVKLFTKQSEHSPIKSFKAVTQVRAKLSALVGLLNNESEFPKWMDKVSQSKTLRKISDNESLLYQVYSMPWPAKDHDAVLYSRWHQDPQTLVATRELIAEPQYLAQNKDRERYEGFSGKWQLTPLENGVVEVTYTAEIDPGTDRALSWLENMLAYEIPIRTMQNLQSMSLDQYAGYRVAYIQEPSAKGLARANP